PERPGTGRAPRRRPEPRPVGRGNVTCEVATKQQPGRPADPEALVDVDRLVRAYHDERPDVSDPEQRVSFGTSGHRGTSFDRTFTESHVLAIAEAVCRHRRRQGIDGPVF